MNFYDKVRTGSDPRELECKQGICDSFHSLVTRHTKFGVAHAINKIPHGLPGFILLFYTKVSITRTLLHNSNNAIDSFLLI